jgi:hypothetical protein
MSTWFAIVPTAVVIVALLLVTVAYRRRGYNVGSDYTIVRCSQGHLFTTIWLPGASFKAIRLGPYRLQRCPVGNHFALVTPVRPDDLTPEERAFAEAHHDAWVP